jgi:hypothetical protein
MRAELRLWFPPSFLASAPYPVKEPRELACTFSYMLNSFLLLGLKGREDIPFLLGGKE